MVRPNDGRPKFTLGIDVGGTNTDAVVMCGKDVIAAAKSFTTEDVRTGVINAVASVLERAGHSPADIHAVMIGTTQFVNAFVQRRELTRVAVFRVSLPKADGVPPLSGWPDELIEAIRPDIYMVGGGSYYTGKEYAPLDEDALLAAAAQAQAKGIRSVAISANFAPLRPDIETRAEAIVRRAMPDASITLSAQVGGLGLIDRENATVINASLAELAVKVVRSLVRAFAELEIHAPLYISQNDGTLLTADVAQQFPILTCAAGPTNSLRGAAFLTGIEEAIVVDVGGTTSDVGFLVRGFPRETTASNQIGGVRTNFRMPDVLSIGLGGGSLVRVADGGPLSVGPQSVGYRLREEALVFGGKTLTATDIAVRAGQAQIGDSSRVADLSEQTVQAALDVMHSMLEEAIDQIKTNARPMPLVLVGGGNILVSRPLDGVSELLRPRYAEVANAVGAAIAMVSGRVDRIYDVSKLGRDAALASAKAEAIEAAVAAGAQPGHVEILEIIELPLSYTRSGHVQIKVRAAGALASHI
ncbi:MAG: hydantoinase/oxoprolinase family protein [Gammaproteobacteria bacterium]